MLSPASSSPPPPPPLPPQQINLKSQIAKVTDTVELAASGGAAKEALFCWPARLADRMSRVRVSSSSRAEQSRAAEWRRACVVEGFRGGGEAGVGGSGGNLGGAARGAIAWRRTARERGARIPTSSAHSKNQPNPIQNQSKRSPSTRRSSRRRASTRRPARPRAPRASRRPSRCPRARPSPSRSRRRSRAS